MYKYECKRCFYKCKRKSDIFNHLNRKKKCNKIGLAYTMNDEDLYNLSIEKISNEKSNNNEDKNKEINEEKEEINEDKKEANEEKKEKNFICSNCNKIFKKYGNFNNHYFKKICQINITNNNTINANTNTNTNINANTNINTQQNIHQQNNINVNVNLVKSFDDDWNVDNIDKFQKLGLILSSSKYSNALNLICDNEKNLNVVYNKNHDYGLVYDKTDNKFNQMNCKEITDLSMEKIHKLLLNFHKEINENLEKNNMQMDKDIFELILKNIEIKYKNYMNNKKINECVNDIISDIYNEKYNESKQICLEILGNNCKEEENGY